MSSADYREPTNEELWTQPQAPQPSQPPHGLAPVPQPPVPAPVHHVPPLPVPAERVDRTVFVLAIVSMAVAIPLTAIAGTVAGIPGLLVAWMGIVLINAVYAWSRRGH